MASNGKGSKIISDGVEASTGEKTTKSRRSKHRDKAKHSAVNAMKGAGRAKKGGGGGKGAWGRPGDEYKYGTKAFINEQDPNYDDEYDDANIYFSSAPEEKEFKAFEVSIRALAKVKEAVRSAAREFFTSVDEKEFATAVSELEADSRAYHEVVKELCRVALDQSDVQTAIRRASKLLRSLVRDKTLTSVQIYRGFYHLFNQIDEVLIDVPRAREHMLYMLQGGSSFGLSEEQTKTLRGVLEHLHGDQKQLKTSKTAVRKMVTEYLNSEDVEELLNCFRELKQSYMGYELVKRSVSVSMDRGSRERELVSKMLASVSGRGITREEMSKGFEILLQRVEDLAIDVPRVLEYLSSFLARAIVDEALAPSFFVNVHIREGDGGYRVVQQARFLLDKRDATTRLANVWGPHSGLSVKALKKTIYDLVVEYFDSEDVTEAVRLAQEIPPQFHHEIIKRVFAIALDRNPREAKLCTKFVIQLGTDKAVLKAQLQKGLGRVEAALEDMALDNVNAPKTYAEIKSEVVGALKL